MRNRAIQVVLSGVSLGMSLLGGRATLAADILTSVQPASATELTEQQKIVHVLNRLGFGPRPGDVERVRKIGIDAYIQQQLHPETIDDSAVDKALEPLDNAQDGFQSTAGGLLGGRQAVYRQAEGRGQCRRHEAPLWDRGLETPSPRRSRKAKSPAERWPAAEWEHRLPPRCAASANCSRQS